MENQPRNNKKLRKQQQQQTHDSGQPQQPQPYATAQNYMYPQTHQNYHNHNYYYNNQHYAQNYYHGQAQWANNTYAAMSYPQYGNSGYNYQYPPGYSDPYAQQPQYQTPPAIRNPFAPPAPAQTAYSKQNSGFDPEQEASIAQWHANYAPQDPMNPQKPNTATAIGPSKDPAAPQISEEKKGMTVMRKGGGKTWEDKSLLEWDPNEFRIQVGNLAGEVTDDSLAKAFDKYGVSKARVIRDKTTTKSKGYGFVSFKDGELGFKAAREMAGKYIGSHPVTIQRSKADLRPTKTKENQHKGKNNRNNNHKKGKDEKTKADPLKANTGAHIEKKPVKNPAGYKMLG